MPETLDVLAPLIADSPVVAEAYDTSTPAFLSYVDRVDEFVAEAGSSIVEAAAELMHRAAPETLGLRVALKIVESRAAVSALTEPAVVTLLNPVYKETGRMQRREEHPHGEDSIRYKAAALDRITALNPAVETRIIVIDDGCPDGSGAMAAGILAELAGWEGRHEVLMLEEARQSGDPDVPPGLTAKDGPRRSVKGGAVLYGMRRSLRFDPGGRRHVIVDNDADLSILPDQLGLVLRGIIDHDLGVVAGSRREADSVALIGESRDHRGSLFIRVWQHLLPQLAERIVDANRAFKAFDADVLARIVEDVEVYTFPYQIEILQAAVSHGTPPTAQGIAYIDSEAASTQQGASITETYVDQIRQIVDIALRYQTIPADDPLIRFINEVDDRTWSRFEVDPPRELLDILGH
jgi:hypothetical protein